MQIRAIRNKNLILQPVRLFFNSAELLPKMHFLSNTWFIQEDRNCVSEPQGESKRYSDL